MTGSADNQLVEKVRGLSDLVWEDHPTWPEIEQWLFNFVGECKATDLERHHALYLLSEFLYFGHPQMRELLRAMFVYLIRQPLTVSVREQMNWAQDFEGVHKGFLSELESSRFLGLGNPAESGTHILYDFRLANRLPLNLFLNPYDLISGPLDDTNTKWLFPQVHRLVVIDDFCGTGKQAVQLGEKMIPVLRRIACRSKIDIEVWYLTVAGTTGGMKKVREANVFDVVRTVSELDVAYKVFHEQSNFYGGSADHLAKADGEQIVGHYGRKLEPDEPFGYKDSQLLIGFHHNVPDNTLPILSRQQRNPPWRAVFPRIAKVGYSEGQL